MECGEKERKHANHAEFEESSNHVDVKVIEPNPKSSVNKSPGTATFALDSMTERFL